MQELVSILIPAYNAEKWIGETLKSAADQTWPRKEIIVVDDGSTDRTAQIAEEFSPAVRVVQQQNQGAAAARNHALSLSSGEWIQWLDADDVLASDKIEKQMAVAKGKSTRTLFSCAWSRFLNRVEYARVRKSDLWQDLSPVDFLVIKIAKNTFIHPNAWLVSRELTQAAGPWDPTMYVDDDGDYFTRVLMASERVVFVADARVYCRSSGPGSLSYIGTSPKKIEAQWRSLQLHIERLRSLEESERVRRASLQLLQDWYPYFYPEWPNIMAEVQTLAVDLGGELSIPHLPWKYRWIKAVLGWSAAKRARLLLRRASWWFAVSREKIFSQGRVAKRTF